MMHLEANLNSTRTRTPASFYKVFPPEEARGLTKKLEFHYTTRRCTADG